MEKAVHDVDDLYVGWSTVRDADKGSEFWCFIGKTHKKFFGNSLYRFIVFNVNTQRVRTEFLSDEGVIFYVLS